MRLTLREALTVEEVKAFYDRFGTKQDAQAFYENPAIDDLVAHAGFDGARQVFEFGCGTGRVAERLLSKELPPGATYEGVDVSSTMVDLASARVQRFGERARVRRIDGSNPFIGLTGRPDRIVTTYVLDLLPKEEIVRFIHGCAEVLEPDGRLCLVSLTFGQTPLSSLVTAGWRGLFRLSPRIVGGCRPIRLLPFLAASAWEVKHHAVISSFGIASEIVVAANVAS